MSASVPAQVKRRLLRPAQPDAFTAAELDVTASHQIGAVPLEVHYQLDADGRMRWFAFDRWGDPDGSGTWSWHPFGGQITAYATFDGVTIPSAGRVGWFFGTDRWPAGEFFRYRITDLHLVTTAHR